MHWKLNLNRNDYTISLPDTIPDNTPFNATINGQLRTLRWQKSTRCLFVLEGQNSSVWKVINPRTFSVGKFQGENESNVSVEFVPAGGQSAISVDCGVGVYIPGQEMRVSAAAKKPRLLRSQITGKVIKVLAKAGDPVASGDVLLIIEAMKMENRVSANTSGTIDKLNVKEGDTVTVGTELVRFKQD